jgi:hypothetical protein
MQTFNIIKRNRKYFAAETNSGHKCRILIDSNSEILELGTQELAVIDISVRSSFGVDLIFKLRGSLAEQKEAGVRSLSHHKYNVRLVSRCKDLGGTWDAKAKCWIFNGLVEDEVDELDYLYNSELVGVELIATKTIESCRSAIYFLGYRLAAANSRDYGAQIESDVAFISGKISSGGSYKYWETIIEKDTVLRLHIPSKLIDSEIGVVNDFDYKILNMPKTA